MVLTTKYSVMIAGKYTDSFQMNCANSACADMTNVDVPDVIVIRIVLWDTNTL